MGRGARQLLLVFVSLVKRVRHLRPALLAIAEHALQALDFLFLLLELGHELLVLGPLLVQDVLQLVYLVLFLAKNQLVVVDVLLEGLHTWFHLPIAWLRLLQTFDMLLHAADFPGLSLTVFGQLVHLDRLLV